MEVVLWIAGWIISAFIFGVLIGRCISFGSGATKGEME